MRAASLLRFAGVLLGTLGLTSTCSAYYFYTHYQAHSAPYAAAYEKFDLNALPNKTVSFFVSDAGPSALYAGDSFAAVVSELRSAAKVWNDVSSSDLRVTYGGLFTEGTTQNSAGIDVMFSQEIPPGLLALSGPATTGSLQTSAAGNFVPIQRSRVLLPSDLSQARTPNMGPSFTEEFFVTLVHEFGHALGLQHTLSSSVMATYQTTASSKAAPLGADDVAGISALYPVQGYSDTVGSISGQVTLSGAGVNLASVVALPAVGPAISALTNPDGTYQIMGLTPGTPYYVYAHPLPPALTSQGETTPDSIRYPVDAKGSSTGGFNTAQIFATQFFPGTADATQAQSITVSAGSTVPRVNFQVQARASEAVSSARTYGWSPTVVAETSPYFSQTIAGPVPLVATGVGLLQNNFTTVTPGLGVQIFQGPGQLYALRPYTGTVYIAMDVQTAWAASNGAGPRHLVFTTTYDSYVLPSAFYISQNTPPQINSLTPAYDFFGDRAVWIEGANLSKDTRFLFDGLPGVVRQITPQGRFLVQPPPAAAGYTAPVTALNPDGQSSLFLQGNTPSTYTYDSASDKPVLTVSPGNLSPGSDVTVTVSVDGSSSDGNHPLFLDGQTVVGFGTSDVVVKSVTIEDPTHLSVVVTPNAFVSTAQISVTTGLRILSGSQGASVNAQPQNR